MSSSADILPTGRDVGRSAHAMAKNWWRSFSYNYVLDAIRTKHENVFFDTNIALLRLR
jgi:hypothetical protein